MMSISYRGINRFRRSDPAAHSKRPPLEPPTRRERVVLYVCAAASSVAGVIATVGFFLYFPVVFLVMGLVHAIVLTGMLWFTRIPTKRAVLYFVLCALFPWWGGFIGMLGAYVFSALLCSLAWGCMLWHLLNDRAAIIAFAIVGSVPSICMLTVLPATGGVLPDWILLGQFGYWHISASFAIVWLGLRYRARHSRRSNHMCNHCGYSLQGLDPDTVCPECGSRPEQERHT